MVQIKGKKTMVLTHSNILLPRGFFLLFSVMNRVVVLSKKKREWKGKERKERTKNQPKLHPLSLSTLSLLNPSLSLFSSPLPRSLSIRISISSSKPATAKRKRERLKKLKIIST